MLAAVALLAVAAMCLLAIRLLMIVPLRRRRHGAHSEPSTTAVEHSLQKAKAAAQKHGHGPDGSFVTLVVLGSGGHTSEMLKLLERLPKDTYRPLHYIIAATDKSSFARIPADQLAPGPHRSSVTYLPRSREVGQRSVSGVSLLKSNLPNTISNHQQF